MVAKKEASLLPEEANSNSFSARLVRWISTAGRFVVVFTELLVISAFISRFWLDRRNSDLSETIRQQKAILQSTQTFERDYTLLQNRLTFIKKYYQNQPDYVSSIESLSQSVPTNIIFKNYVFQQLPDGRISSDLSFISLDENSLIDFITNLTLNPDIDSVEINTIEKKEKESYYSSSVEVIYKIKSSANART